jgi:hypothetical protein
VSSTTSPSPVVGKPDEIVKRLDERAVSACKKLDALNRVLGLKGSNRTTLLRARDVLLAQVADIEALSAEVAGLADPATVRVNILRGTIAIPDDLVWLHDTNGPVAGLRAALAAANARAEEMRKIAATLGCEDDPFAAWETLELVLTALRFYADERVYGEMDGDEALRLFGEAHCMVNKLCLTSGPPGRIRVEVPVGRAVPPILSDWGKRARDLLARLNPAGSEGGADG